MDFREINIADLSFKPFELISKDWMLITSGDAQGFNTMTASWGGLGVLWHKNVATVYIRPQRYTYEFVEKNDLLTLSFFWGGAPLCAHPVRQQIRSGLRQGKGGGPHPSLCGRNHCLCGGKSGFGVQKALF